MKSIPMALIALTGLAAAGLASNVYADTQANTATIHIQNASTDTGVEVLPLHDWNHPLSNKIGSIKLGTGSNLLKEDTTVTSSGSATNTISIPAGSQASLDFDVKPTRGIGAWGLGCRVHVRMYNDGSVKFEKNATGLHFVSNKTCEALQVQSAAGSHTYSLVYVPHMRSTKR